MSCVVRFSSAAVSWGWRGRSHGHLSGWWDGAPGPTSVAASLPGALGTAEAGRLDSRVTLLLNPNGRWTSLGQHKRKPEFPVVIREFCLNLRKTTYLFSMGSSGPRNRLGVSCTAGRFFTSSATREVYLFHNMLSQISLEFKALPRDVGDTIQKHRTTVVQA